MLARVIDGSAELVAEVEEGQLMQGQSFDVMAG